MKKAILHIGTEKTGTTSIQTFLFQNRFKLLVAGRLFPASAGYTSNRRLVVFGKRAPEADLAPHSLDVADPVALGEWKEQFVHEHCAEVMAFHARHPQDSTVIYSSEHLQSRLTSIDEIKRVARLLRPLYDKVSVVVYLRRQDKYALSAYSTSVRGGNQRLFSFEDIHSAGPYYNYRKLIENWTEVFGEDSLTVRVFERQRMVGGDVVADFCQLSGIDAEELGLEWPDAENEALSFTALSLLRAFNALDSADPRLQGIPRRKLRSFLLDKVQTIRDDYGHVLPTRESAMAFHEKFADDNQWIAERWLGAEGFEASFNNYPEQAIELPVVSDIEQRLDALIDSYPVPRRGFAKHLRKVVPAFFLKAG